MSDQKVVVEFLAEDGNYRRALERQVETTVRSQQANESRAQQAKRSAEDEARAYRAQEAMLDALIRKQRDLANAAKAAQGQMIRSGTVNWQHASRGGGMVPTTNWSFSSPPTAGYLNYGGGFSPAGYLGYGGQARTNFTMHDADIPRLGFGRGGGLAPGGTFDAPQSLQMVNPLGAVFGALTRQAAGLVGGFVALETIVKAANFQLEMQVARQTDAKDAAKDMARGQAEVFLNMAGESEADKAKVIAAGKEIASQTGLPPGGVLSTLGRQQGRGQGLTIDQRLEASRLTAGIARHTPEQFEPLNAGVQQTMRVGKTDAKTAAALFASASANAYIGDPTLQARFLTNSLSGSIPAVPNPNLESVRQILAFGDWASQEVGEERGEQGRTAVITMMQEMDQFGRGEGPWATTNPFRGTPVNRPIKDFPTQPMDRIKFLQEHPEMRARFKHHFSARRMFEGTFERLLEPGSQQALNLQGMNARIKPDYDALATLQREMASGTPQITSSNKLQQTQVRKNLADAGDIISQRQGEATEIRNDVAKRLSAHRFVGDQGLMNRIRDTLMLAPEGTALTQARQARTDLMMRYGDGAKRGDPQARGDYRYFESQIKRLEEIRDEIKALRSGAPQPGMSPAANAAVGSRRER